jgi:hypothetical protein
MKVCPLVLVPSFAPCILLCLLLLLLLFLFDPIGDGALLVELLQKSGARFGMLLPTLRTLSIKLCNAVFALYLKHTRRATSALAFVKAAKDQKEKEQTEKKDGEAVVASSLPVSPPPQILSLWKKAMPIVNKLQHVKAEGVFGSGSLLVCLFLSHGFLPLFSSTGGDPEKFFTECMDKIDFLMGLCPSPSLPIPALSLPQQNQPPTLARASSAPSPLSPPSSSSALSPPSLKRHKSLFVLSSFSLFLCFPFLIYILVDGAKPSPWFVC